MVEGVRVRIGPQTEEDDEGTARDGERGEDGGGPAPPRVRTQLLRERGLHQWDVSLSGTTKKRCYFYSKIGVDQGLNVFQIQFEGSACEITNFSYHVSFSSIFFVLALTSLIQLVMCIHAGKCGYKAINWFAYLIHCQILLSFRISSNEEESQHRSGVSDHNAKVPLLPYLCGFDAQGGILRGTGAYSVMQWRPNLLCEKRKV